MKVLTINRKTQFKTDKAELIISLICLVNGIHMSKTEIKVLAYYVVYGIKEKTDELLLSSQIVKNLQAFRNLKSRLAKMGFLKSYPGLRKSYELNMAKDFNLESTSRVLIEIQEA